MKKFVSTFLIALASQALIACGGGGGGGGGGAQTASKPTGEKTATDSSPGATASADAKLQPGETGLFVNLLVKNQSKTDCSSNRITGGAVPCQKYYVRQNSFILHNLDTDKGEVLHSDFDPRLQTEDGRLFVGNQEWNPQSAQKIENGAAAPDSRSFVAKIVERLLPGDIKIYDGKFVLGTGTPFLEVNEQMGDGERLVASFKVDEDYSRFSVAEAYGILYIVARHSDGAKIDILTYDSTRGAQLVASVDTQESPGAIDAAHERLAVALGKKVLYVDLARGTRKLLDFGYPVEDVAVVHIRGAGEPDPAASATKLPEVQPPQADSTPESELEDPLARPEKEEGADNPFEMNDNGDGEEPGAPLERPSGSEGERDEQGGSESLDELIERLYGDRETSPRERIGSEEEKEELDRRFA